MATISYVSAQSSFTAAKNRYISDGKPTIADLRARVSTAIAAVLAQTYLIAGDFTDAEVAMSDPLDTGGGNLLHSRLLADLGSGDYGIGSTLEASMLSLSTTLEGRVMASAVADTARLFTAGGYTAPTAVSTAMTARLQAEQTDRLRSIERDLNIKNMEVRITGRKDEFAAALGVESNAVAAFLVDVNRLLQILQTKLEQYKTQSQSQLELAVAALRALNVSIGLSVAGSASVSGDESASEHSDLTVGSTRDNYSTSYDESHSTRSSTSASYETSINAT